MRAVALFKMVDGESVEMSPEEEAATRAEWAANDPTLIVRRRVWTPLQFLERFTMAEQFAIKVASRTDDALGL